jgi:hypothetical protein
VPISGKPEIGGRELDGACALGPSFETRRCATLLRMRHHGGTSISFFARRLAT